jgi:HD-GYP domain-containing protein (c-di-GMP phosphodiesterase class II)
MARPVPRSARASAAWAAGTFVLLGYAWTLLSDQLSMWLTGNDDELLAQLQRWKGLAFVTVTGVVLYKVVRAHGDRVASAHARLSEAYDETLAGWAAALDIRDHSTACHTRRVTEISVALGQELGIDGADLVQLRRGATLHDIGKMGVPDSILGKPGPLTEAEWVLMREHPRLAVDMLVGIEHLRPALDIPWCHHERWDGGGYPRGLAGPDIPLAARVFSVVDVYDAVTNVRPYRCPMSHREALALIRAGSGTQFDPEIVTAFMRLAGAPRFEREYAIN